MRIQNFLMHELLAMRDFFLLFLLGILIIVTVQNYKLSRQLESFEYNTTIHTLSGGAIIFNNCYGNPLLNSIYPAFINRMDSMKDTCIKTANVNQDSVKHLAQHLLLADKIYLNAKKLNTTSKTVIQTSQSIENIRTAVKETCLIVIGKDDTYDSYTDTSALQNNPIIKPKVDNNLKIKSKSVIHLSKSSKPRDSIADNIIFKDY